jgi:hypothetical protein
MERGLCLAGFPSFPSQILESSVGFSVGSLRAYNGEKRAESGQNYGGDPGALAGRVHGQLPRIAPMGVPFPSVLKYESYGNSECKAVPALLPNLQR